jgi:hypothetical protein
MSRSEHLVEGHGPDDQRTVWLPMLPPVPISSGMKKLRATAASSSSEKDRQHGARVGLGDEEEEQPADPLPDEERDARQAVGDVQRL